MYTDMLGKKRVKLGLHIHTTRSDGVKDPAEAAALYRNEGYDAVAFTDHWIYGEGSVIAGLPVLSGGEFHVGVSDSVKGVYHIVCLCAEREPVLREDMTAQQVIDSIHKAGGLAVLAHPAWSLNTPEMILALRDVDATEIYNAVSECGHSRRADSSLIVDMLASRGLYLPLLAVDDTHYFGSEEQNDVARGYIMAECEDVSPSAVRQAIRTGRFYATQGPEIHLTKKDGAFVVDCSPVEEIVFLSNFVYAHRVFGGHGLTHATYRPRQGETYIRAVVKDRDGKQAWSNILRVSDAPVE